MKYRARICMNLKVTELKNWTRTNLVTSWDIEIDISMNLKVDSRAEGWDCVSFKTQETDWKEVIMWLMIVTYKGVVPRKTTKEIITLMK